MAVNRLDNAGAASNVLGDYLRDRRARLDPAELGFTPGRRRTPGLRREEVAQRANISPAWYTWLEQGRGGAPSAEVLGRIAESLMLNQTEREHLFFLGLGRAPRPEYRVVDAIAPRLQRFLDTMESTSAYIKTPTGDVVAWNKAATILLYDFGGVPPGECNIIKLMFKVVHPLAQHENWKRFAQLTVSRFRADVTRAGATADVAALVAELSVANAQFADLWAGNDVSMPNENDILTMDHAVFGAIELEHSRFTVDARPDLSLLVHAPVDAAIRARLASMVRAAPDQ